MRTQIQAARSGAVTPAMEAAARAEGVPTEKVRDEVAAGRAVIPANPAHAALIPAVIGRAFRTKVNANLGFSPERSTVEEELRKMKVALEAGADFVMDLSVGKDLAALRVEMIRLSPVALGTVPIYEALARVGGKAKNLESDALLGVIRDQAAQGVDFMTLHAGVLRRHIPLAVNRKMGIVSRGGAILAEWMLHAREENPLFARWDDVLEICLRHDVTVSLGDGLRPGCLADASDEAQFAELEVLGQLVRRCRLGGVQVMVEGPGHLPYDQVQMNVAREQEVCDGAPFYVLGPVVTDIAAGHDHIASAIGATAAAFHGASLLCYVTPAEHLGLPSIGDVREGVIAHRIAAHAADVARGLPGARNADDRMARARMEFDWDRQFDLALDGRCAKARFEESQGGRRAHGHDYCSMCGREYCAVRATDRIRKSVTGAAKPNSSR